MNKLMRSYPEEINFEQSCLANNLEVVKWLVSVNDDIIHDIPDLDRFIDELYNNAFPVLDFLCSVYPNVNNKYVAYFLKIGK